MIQCPLVVGSYWRTPILYSVYPAGDSSRVIAGSPPDDDVTPTPMDGSFNWLRQGCLRGLALAPVHPSPEEIRAKLVYLVKEANIEEIELPIELLTFFNETDNLWTCLGDAHESGIDLSGMIWVEGIGGPIIRVFDRLSLDYWAYICLSGKFCSRIFFSECAFDLNFSMEFFESGHLPPLYDTGLSLEPYMYRIWMENYIFYYLLKDYYENAPSELTPEVSNYWQWLSTT